MAAAEAATRRRRTAGKAPGETPASPAQKAAGKAPVVFLSEHMRHHVIVRPAEEWYTNHGSRQTQDKGVMLQFNNYRCSVTADLVDEVKELPCFTGIGEKKTLWVEGEWAAPSQDLQTVQGPILAGPRIPTVAPHPQWDNLSPAEIESIIAEGGIDLERALVYEKGQLNRGIIRRIIAQAIVKGTDEQFGVTPAEVDQDEGIDDTFGGEALTAEPGGVV